MIIYCAGVQSRKDLIDKGHVKNPFITFFVYQSNQEFAADVAYMCDRADRLFVDSGAHTWFAASHNVDSAVSVKSSVRVPDHFDYFDRYLEAAKQVRASPHGSKVWFAELDIGPVIGQSHILDWRKKILASGAADRFVIVWHPDVESWSEFDRVARSWPSKYVGVESTGRGNGIDYPRLAYHFYKLGIKTHGFAMTKVEHMKITPFYSVDSTSWMQFERFGLVTIRDLVKAKAIGEFSRRLAAKDVFYDKVILKRFCPKSAKSELGKKEWRSLSGIKDFGLFQDQITDLWKSRGVVWP
ncbi:hypothetical protein UFOVP329_65 [uncultured Caudovirales phage]|uniref:Uncharacterized protein n=1 Tax=uncultured Caudovirales phage TaxID=2100421 RepID=A0A6J5LYS4_9CAUD|nr:hypothetical protein UFOVP329_65 [uncultured Caudovirales phage]